MRRIWSMGLLAAALLNCDSPTGSDGVASVEITPTTTPPATYIALLTAQEIQLRADLKGSNGNVLQGRVIWQSTNPAVASVDSTGLVRTAATYAVCNYVAPPGCFAAITATASGRSDTVHVVVGPDIHMEGIFELTLVVGDSARISLPIGRIDGSPQCSFFLAFVQPVEIVTTNSSGYFVGLAPGDATAGWMSAHNLCRSLGFSTVIHVVPR